MAYMNFNSASWHQDTTLVVEASAADVSRFSPVELRVIDFAQRVDATREIAPHGRLGRFIEWALGVRLGRPLADPRLERLRRFASLARHHRNDVGERDVQSLIEAGYSPGQAYGLLDYLIGGQPAKRTAH